MKKLLLIICLLAFSSANAQKWGLYTLYSVKGSNTAFLMDTNNTIYKTWTFANNKKTCFSSYLIPGDTLVRTVLYSGNVITGGPISGEVQKIDWNNNVVWDYIYSDSMHVTHHDICPMPNGNVLMIALDVKTAAEGTQAGGSVSMLRHSDKIIEVQPTGPTSGIIVWEWNLWDHLCQTNNPAKDNYVTSLLLNPQLLNINYNNSIDFFHMNGIDYNPVLDQICFSSYTFSEIFVIDHSTTTTEAAGHTGGNSGHGGDLIYRWGNPAAYGASATAVFNVVHDAHWIAADHPYFPNYLCGFNNTGGAGGKTAIDVISPPYNGYHYNLTPGTAYNPPSYAWLYTAPTTSDHEGSSQQLPNGNSLVCLTFCDTILEVNLAGTTLGTITTTGAVSNALRYSKCYVRGPVATAIASSVQVTAGTAINLYANATSVTEINPGYTYSWSSVPSGFSSSSQNPGISPTATATYIVTVNNTALGCSDTASVTVTVGSNGIISAEQPEEIIIYPLPFIRTINLKNANGNENFELINAIGQCIWKGIAIGQQDFSALAGGIYFLKVNSQNTVHCIKLLKE